MERARGIEPLFFGWKPKALPLDDTRLYYYDFTQFAWWIIRSRTNKLSSFTFIESTIYESQLGQIIERPMELESMTFCSANRCSTNWTKVAYFGGTWENWTLGERFYLPRLFSKQVQQTNIWLRSVYSGRRVRTSTCIFCLRSQNPPCCQLHHPWILHLTTNYLEFYDNSSYFYSRRKIRTSTSIFCLRIQSPSCCHLHHPRLLLIWPISS